MEEVFKIQQHFRAQEGMMSSRVGCGAGQRRSVRGGCGGWRRKCGSNVTSARVVRVRAERTYVMVKPDGVQRGHGLDLGPTTRQTSLGRAERALRGRRRQLAVSELAGQAE